MATRDRFHYGWVIVIISCLVMASSAGVVMGFGVFIEPLQTSMGWSRSAISLAYSINMLSLAVAALVMGALSDRIGTRPVVAIGGVLLTAGLGLSALARRPLHLYLTYGVLAAAGSGAAYGTLSYLVARWFEKRKGLAMGIVLAGTGVGIVITAPIVRGMTFLASWRLAFVALAGIGALIAGVALLLLREDPKELGLMAYGASATGDIADAGVGEGRWTNAAAARTGAFWKLLGTFFCCCTCHSGPVLQVTSYAIDVGVSRGQAAGLLSLIGASSIVGRIGLGALGDRIGAKGVLIMALGFQTFMGLWLVGTRSPWAFYTFAIIFGLGVGGVYSQYPVLAREYFGASKVGAVYGGQVFASFVGMAAGGYLAAYLLEASGRPQVAFLFSFAVGLVSLALAASIRPPQVPALARTGAGVRTSEGLATR